MQTGGASECWSIDKYSATHQNTAAGNGVVVVVVTYGHRAALLQKTLAALHENSAIARIIVVDNGCPDPVIAAVLPDPARTSVIRINGNIGSAGGFATGISAAITEENGRFLCILDDDNVVEPDFFETLIALHAARAIDEVAFAAVRLDRPHYVTLLADAACPEERRNAFLGFHVLELPKRLLRRSYRLQRCSKDATRFRPIQAAPYGGLFLTLDTARRIGVPQSNFILYADDHEYTRRLSQAGVVIYLTDYVTVRDVDISWNLPAHRRSPLIDIDAPPWRIYYAVRNHVYLEQTAQGRQAWVHFINSWVYSARLFGEACATYRRPSIVWRALRPYRHAVTDARRARLGHRLGYDIPGWSAAEYMAFQARSKPEPS